MDKEQITTRFDEVRQKTTDLKQLAGKFLAASACKTWTEYFVDSDTGEIVSIERSQVIMKKGTKLDGDKLSELNFSLQSGDVTEVEVTNQVRGGITEDFYAPQLFEVTARMDLMKYKYLLHALSVRQAYDIAADWLEQGAVQRYIYILGVKSLSYYSYLRPAGRTEEEEADITTPFYKASAEIWKTAFAEDKEKPQRAAYKYILQAADVKEANDIVRQRLRATEDAITKAGERVIRTATVAASPYQLTGVIPREFCEVYIQHRLAETQKK